MYGGMWLILALSLYLFEVKQIGGDPNEEASSANSHLLTYLLQDITRLRHEIDNLKGQSMRQGAVYIRWGRTTCSERASVVYTGYMAGAQTDETGGTAEHLCLPNNPQWGTYVDGLQSRSHVWGTEYHNNYGYGPSSPFFRKSNNNGQSLYQHNVPCALCQVPGSSIAWTMPAMVDCPAGWTREYHGYLMSGFYRHSGRVKYECIDEAPEAVPGGGAYERGSTLHFMETRCTPLQCPPYVEGRELTCAVCTR